MNSKKLARFELNAYKRIGSTFNKKNKYLKYRFFANSSKYFIYKHIGGANKIVAAYGNAICIKKNETTLYLYPNYKSTHLKYKIILNKKTFDSLLPNSKIDLCFILPYCRNCSAEEIVDSWRLVIVTNKCQVFHNYPSRSASSTYEGNSELLDIVHFDESAVWDLPNHKYPSNSKDVDLNEFFFPGFSEESYEYHPAINGKIINKYGNTGFPKYKITDDGSFISRFYFPERDTSGNPFFYLNGLEVDSKITALGTYRSNTNHSSRIVLLVTTDGGRNWYTKYEFSDLGEYAFRQGDSSQWGLNHGKPINGECIKDEIEGRFWVKKRTLIFNEDDNYQSFSNIIDIKTIHKSNPILVETTEKHGLENGNLVVLCGEGTNGEIKYLLNNEVTSNNPGNGLFYKVVVESDHSFYLYENVSNVQKSLPCRHVHFIDRARDGWTIGTGEVYPNGWILFMSSREGDTYSIINPEKPFDITQLTFKSNSIQRAMGLYFFEREKENYLIYASDHDLLDRDCKIDSVTLKRNSTGVFVGKASSLNNYKDTFPLFETNEPCLFFKLIGDTFIFGGQRGLIAFGHNYGETWEITKTENALKRYFGETFDFLVIDNYLLMKK